MSADNLQKNDIQSIAFPGLGQLRSSIVAPLVITDRSKARHTISEFANSMVSFGKFSRKENDNATQLLLTYRGLKQLTDAEKLVGLSREFKQGITPNHRSRALGDTGPNAPEQWAWSDRFLDVVFVLYGEKLPELERRTKDILQRIDGMDSVKCNDQSFLNLTLREREPFGFQDGIVNPNILEPESFPPGEAVHGYRNYTGGIQSVPDWLRNSSYVVVRQLEQHVQEFWKFWLDEARDPQEAIWMASKAVGRWPNGMPMTQVSSCPQPQAVEEMIKKPLSFRNDLSGLKCPFGSHVRRSHPRDGLSENVEQSLKISSLHRIIRRGRLFGPPPNPNWYPHGVIPDSSKLDMETSQPENENQPGSLGLMFACLCTDIARQFEFIQQSWINNPKMGRPFTQQDPIASIRDKATDFSIPSEPFSKRIDNIPSFTRLLGAGYFFLPGRQAIRFLTS